MGNSWLWNMGIHGNSCTSATDAHNAWTVSASRFHLCFANKVQTSGAPQPTCTWSLEVVRAEFKYNTITVSKSLSVAVGILGGLF